MMKAFLVCLVALIASSYGWKPVAKSVGSVLKGKCKKMRKVVV